jgi:hypothetical protein
MVSNQCTRGKHTVYNDALAPFQTGGDSIGFQIEPGFTHEGIYRHVASSNDEKHSHSHSLSRQCVDDGELRRQVACRVAKVLYSTVGDHANLRKPRSAQCTAGADRSVSASATLDPSRQFCLLPIVVTVVNAGQAYCIPGRNCMNHGPVIYDTKLDV